jgi:VWFA-related protein
MRIFRTLAATALVICGGFWLGGHAQGQQQAPPPAQPPATPAQPPAPEQKPVFRTGAELVRVDVVVLDRKGQPVSTLTADEFELQEEGTTQEIRSFQFVKADGQPDADNELSLTIRSRSHAAAEAAKDNVRVFLIFWDEYHIGQMASATRARASLMQFVRTAFGPTDIVAFMDPLTPIDSLWFTRDRLELFERTRKLVGRSGIYVPTRSAVEDAHLERGDVERLRSEVTLSALKSAAVHLGGLRDGRKSIILISEGLRGMMRDSQTLLSDLIRTANDNNTAIYAIDPRGFGPQRFASLLEGVAEDTGGQYFRSNDLAMAMHQVVTQSGGFYLLGYSAAERANDGRFHKIRVKVKTPGLEVRARSGYWAPSVADLERARTKAVESAVPPEISRALGDLPKATARRAVDLWVGASIDGGRPVVRLSWLPRGSADAGMAKPAQVAAVAAHGDEKVFEGPVEASGTAFEAPPGPLKVTATVQDGAGEVIDREVRTIEVPDPQGQTLSMSAPVLFRTQSALELRSLDRGPSAVPYPGREFVRTDRLHIRFSVYGATASTATVTARMISQWGKDLAALPLVARASADAPYDLDLPLSSVARGEFLIAITATSGSETVRAFVPIRITR